jgi:hypothetical protein
MKWDDEHRQNHAEGTRRWWADLPAEEKARRLEAMQTALRGRPRSPEHARKIGEASRALWAAGGPKFQSRECRGCGETFTPNSGPQRYCTPKCKSDSRYAGKYGFPAREYRAMFERQGGKCALCGEGEKGWSRGRPLHVDHCHKTGRIRGLLCGDCNTALGRFGDDPTRLRAAIVYLEAHLQS